MRFLVFSLLSLVLLAFVEPGASAVLTEPPGWRWSRLNDSEYILWFQNQQVGNLRVSDHKYFERLGPGKFLAAPCPIDLPADLPPLAKKPGCDCSQGCDCGDDCQCGRSKPICNDHCRCVLKNLPGVVEDDGTLNFGVSPQTKPGKHYLGDKEVSREELLQALEKGDVPQDADLLFLTVIGDEASRKAILAALDSDPALASYKDKIRRQSYASDDWAVKESGFVCQAKSPGQPIIYVQAPDGKVLHRQEGYRGPAQLAEALGKAFGKLRKPDPHYEPDKDPDLTRRLPSLPFDLGSLPPWAWVLGGVALLIFFSPTVKDK